MERSSGPKGWLLEMSLRDVIAFEESRPRAYLTKRQECTASLLGVHQMLEESRCSLLYGCKLDSPLPCVAPSLSLAPPPVPLSCVQVSDLLPSALTRNLEEYLRCAHVRQFSVGSDTSLSGAAKSAQCLAPSGGDNATASRVARLLGAMQSRYKYGGNPNFKKQSDDMLRNCLMERDRRGSDGLVEKIDGFLQFAHELCAPTPPAARSEP